MTADCPLALLKAQTIAARSTWLATRGRHHHGEAFDICADDHCQCYRGSRTIADTSAAAAVDETEGQVLCPRGLRLRRALQQELRRHRGGLRERLGGHARRPTCPLRHLRADPEPPPAHRGGWRQWILAGGGRVVQHGALAGAGGPAGLQRRLLPLDREPAAGHRPPTCCAAAPQAWTFSRLHGPGAAGAPRAVRPPAVPAACRRTEGVLHPGQGAQDPPGPVRKPCLYSAAIWFEWQGDTLHIHGKGWGHGVGMCQLGAARMALEGTRLERDPGPLLPGSELRAGLITYHTESQRTDHDPRQHPRHHRQHAPGALNPPGRTARARTCWARWSGATPRAASRSGFPRPSSWT
jgi:hypothetical protein